MKVLHGALLGALIGVSGLGWAQQQKAPSPGEKLFPKEQQVAMQARVDELNQRAKAARQAAEAQYKQEQLDCWQNTLVSACQETSERRRQQNMLAARKLELEASDLDRDIRTRTRDARRADAQDRLEKKRNKGLEMQVQTRNLEQKRAEDEARREQKHKDAATRAAAEQSDRAQSERDATARRAKEAEKAAARAEAARKQAEKIDRKIAERDRRMKEREAREAARAAQQGVASPAVAPVPTP